MDAQTTQRERKPGVIHALLTFLRRLMVLAILVALGFLALWFYAKHRIHEEIRRRVETEFAAHFAPRGLAVTIQSARLIEGEGIEIRHVRIIDSKRQGKPAEIARIDEVFVVCGATMQDLLTKPAPQAKRIAIRRMKLLAVRDASGQWNLARLWPPPKTSEQPAPISIENASVDIVASAQHPDRVIAVRDIFAAITPVTGRAKLAPWLTQGAPPASTPLLHLSGGFTADHLKQIKFEGVFDPVTSFGNARGEVSTLQLSPQFYESLPDEVRPHTAVLSALRGQLSLSFSVSHHPARGTPLEFAVGGKLSDGRIEDHRLPYPVTDITADVRCDSQGIFVDNLTALSGAGSIRLTFRRQGFQNDSPFFLKARAEQIELDQRLAGVLPGEPRKLWDKLSPAGTLDLDATISFDGQKYHPHVAIDCHNVSFAHYEFPYRVRGCIGEIRVENENCTVDLRALIGGREARFEGNLQNPGPACTGHLEVSLDGPIEINDEIISAIKDKSRGTVKSFNPRGEIKVSARFERSDPSAARADQKITIELIGCAISYDKFPYPVDRITGKLEMVNGAWNFRNLQGFNDSGTIECNGSFRRDADGADQLEVTFIGNAIALEDELRQSLKPQMQTTWSNLRPRGTLDYVKAIYRHSVARHESSLYVMTHKELEEAEDVAGRGIAIHPVWFPYRMDDVTGTVHFRDGEVTMEDIKARHGATRLSMRGECSFTDDTWKVWFQQLKANRLRPDNELIAALPGKLGDAITQLNLTGILTLDGSLAVSGSNDPRQSIQSNWDLTLDVEGGDIDCGIQLKDIRGGLHLIGDYSSQGVRSVGELKVDSVIYENIQFTNVQGPMWIDDSHVAFGRWAKGPPNQEPRSLSAQVFGGQIAGDANVTIEQVSRFDLWAVLKGGDIAQITRDLTTTNSMATEITGKADAQIRLVGTNQGTNTFRGGGAIALYDADIFKVPVMFSLLKILKLKPADAAAFSTSNMDFRIHGPNVYFDRLDFGGDSFSLRGNGEMGFNHEINFTFYTIMGRNEFVVPLVSPILGMASREFLRIHVDGTLEKPNKPVREVLPGLNDTLRQLFPELENRDANAKRPSMFGSRESKGRTESFDR